MENIIELIYIAILIGLGYFIGTIVEKKHYKSIIEREKLFLNLPAVTSKNLLDEDKIVERTQLSLGNVVIGADYFKFMLAGLKNLLGGEVSAFETILDRGRREAILRLKQNAIGADIILNLRIETSRVSQMGSVEVFAYGTAVYYKK